MAQALQVAWKASMCGMPKISEKARQTAENRAWSRKRPVDQTREGVWI